MKATKSFAILSIALLALQIGAMAATGSSPTPTATLPANNSAPTTITPQPASNVPVTGAGIKPARKIFSGWIPYYSVRASVAR